MSKQVILTENERQALVNALHVAKLQYRIDADRYTKAACLFRGDNLTDETRDRLQQQFNDQANGIEHMADRIEQCDDIKLINDTVGAAQAAKRA